MQSRIKANSRVNLSNFEPVEESAGSSPMPMPPQTIMSPFMSSSLPTAAATYDQFARQFYGRDFLPSYRILTPDVT
jgi:hypothetical protein